MYVDIPSNVTTPKAQNSNFTDLWIKKITLYNVIPKKTQVETIEQHWDRTVIDKCNVQGDFVTKLNGNIPNIVNLKTVYIRDIEHYLSPSDYDMLPVREASNYYTVRNGDFIVFDEVFDEVTTATQYSQLQQKYKDNGIRVNTISVNINGMALDNITITA